MIIKDQLNRNIRLPRSPVRIVSLVPSQTELLVDLGLRKNLVGITKFCVHPKDLREEIKVVGGTKTVHYSKIEVLAPDLIICNKEENTLEMVQALEAIAPVWVSDIKNISDCIHMIAQLGELCKRSEESSVVIDSIQSAQSEFLDRIKDREHRKVLYLIWKDPYMAAAKDTFIDSMLELNKFQNVFSENDTRYPEVEESFFEMADLILLSSEPYPFKKEHAEYLRNKYKKEVMQVNGEYFSWYGSRLIEGFKYFSSLDP
ncbi:ABC transporter substrate-binding protein [Constantimarinum furrinae]|uniref:Iron complex transport system substrate-binding protein n=1 Tax=Constantimarinum furrinae TaxID=2562285 RepID=A0A7G8PR24_9FLAO|nr:helical backbone metal receptor [Constantimarinum furrinae]QNJ96790.1 iron complex transport system substrate-binding protein [Constantimarinum furrinae]